MYVLVCELRLSDHLLCLVVVTQGETVSTDEVSRDRRALSKRPKNRACHADCLSIEQDILLSSRRSNHRRVQKLSNYLNCCSRSLPLIYPGLYYSEIEIDGFAVLYQEKKRNIIIHGRSYHDDNSSSTGTGTYLQSR